MKKKINLSIRNRLLLIGALVGFSIVIMLGLQTYTSRSINALEKDALLTRDIEIGMLNLRRAKKDFLARRQMKYAGKFDKHYAAMQEKITTLDTSLQQAGIDNTLLHAAAAALEKYARTFHALVAVQQRIGLNPKDGLYGRLRTAVHHAEGRIKELGDHELLADMLMLRRREKDFMLREKEKYIGKFKKDYAMFGQHLASRDYGKELRASLNGAMQTYRTDFLKLFEGYKEKGLDSKSGLRGKMRAAVHEAEKRLQLMKEQVRTAAEAHKSEINRIAWGMTLVMVTVLFALVYFLAHSIIKPVKSLSALMEKASQNKDLTLRSQLRGSDELSIMAKAFNGMMENFHEMLSKVMNASDSVRAATEQLGVITEQTAQGVMRQHSESDQVSTAMNEMSATVQEVSRQAQDAATASSKADQEAAEGKRIMAENSKGVRQLAEKIEVTSHAINQLSDESQNIGTVLQVIRDIAEQTNLLALNAAIEAARAGEQGRGFAVVADEVRNLAQRSHNSTEEIQDIVERLQQKADDAVKAMASGQEEAQNSVERAGSIGEALDSVLSEITAISNMNAQIASAAEEQSSVAEEINRSIVEIARISNETAEGAKETTNTSRNLTSLSQELYQMVGQFKL